MKRKHVEEASDGSVVPTLTPLGRDCVSAELVHTEYVRRRLPCKIRGSEVGRKKKRGGEGDGERENGVGGNETWEDSLRLLYGSSVIPGLGTEPFFASIDSLREQTMTKIGADLEEVTMVDVETRKSGGSSFGSARSSDDIRVPFHTFLDWLSSGEAGESFPPVTSMYLSTQPPLSPELEKLLDRFAPGTIYRTAPLSLLSHVLPDSPYFSLGEKPVHVNAWLGPSTSSSSGLHFDHHDNFYHPLQGFKRFRLISPDFYSSCYLRGEWVRTSYGLDYPEPEVADGNDGGGDVGGEDYTEDYPRSIVEDCEMQHGSQDSDSSEDSEPPYTIGNPDYVDSDDDVPDPPSAAITKPDAAESRPHFSLLDPNMYDAEKFPLFEKVPTATVDVGPGECLFIPGGWLHEVRSYTSPPSDWTGSNATSTSFHLAINFWYEPYGKK